MHAALDLFPAAQPGQTGGELGDAPAGLDIEDPVVVMLFNLEEFVALQAYNLG